MEGTTRNPDPFAYGIGYVDDRLTLDNVFEKIFDSNIKGRNFVTHRDEEFIQAIIKFITEHGAVRRQELVKAFGKVPEHIKDVVTYRCIAWESDDGRWLGVLDENGNEVPRKVPTDFNIVINREPLCKYKVTVDGVEEYHTSINSIGKKHGVHNKVLKRIAEGGKSKKFPWINVEYVKDGING